MPTCPNYYTEDYKMRFSLPHRTLISRDTIRKLIGQKKEPQTPQTPKIPIGRTKFQRLRYRDLISFEDYTRSEIFSLLWVATELKQLKQERPSIDSKRIGMLWSSPLMKASISHASQSLNASLYCIHDEQIKSTSNNLEMLGRSMGYVSDIIFLDMPSWTKSNIEEFATGCTCPVITITSKYCSPGLVFSQLLTLFEKYGFLRRLIIVYIGSGNSPILNTYFTLLPTIGAHLRTLVDGAIEDLSVWEKGIHLASINNTEIGQFNSFDDAIYRAHTISTCFTESPHLNLQIKRIEEMDLEWTFLQSDVFKGVNVSRDFLNQKGHSLLSDVVTNQSWILQALVAAHTTDYTPSIQPPRFEGVD